MIVTRSCQFSKYICIMNRVPRMRPWPLWPDSWGPACSMPDAVRVCVAGPRRLSQSVPSGASQTCAQTRLHLQTQTRALSTNSSCEYCTTTLSTTLKYIKLQLQTIIYYLTIQITTTNHLSQLASVYPQLKRKVYHIISKGPKKENYLLQSCLKNTNGNAQHHNCYYSPV